MDIDKLREFTELLAQGADFDADYTFYYDETNNVRKFHLKKGRFNADPTANFVLGGFAFSGERPKETGFFEGEQLRDGDLKGVDEIKFSHIAWGDFEACLTSKRLHRFFVNVSKIDVLFHLAGLNLLYYSLVDIVDSALEGSGSRAYHLSKPLKDALYFACKQDLEKVVDLFFRYEYPAIASECVGAFALELISFLEQFKNHPEWGGMIRFLSVELEKAAENNSLPFIEGTETENSDYAFVLIDGLLASYQRPVYLFPNSYHNFDNESEIVDKIRSSPMRYKGVELTNYTFIDSTSDVFIEASDAVVGLAGKFFKFINNNTEDSIKVVVSNMTALQLENLDFFLELIEKSIQVNPGLINYVDGTEEARKVALIGFLRGKNI